MWLASNFPDGLMVADLGIGSYKTDVHFVDSSRIGLGGDGSTRKGWLLLRRQEDLSKKSSSGKYNEPGHCPIASSSRRQIDTPGAPNASAPRVAGCGESGAGLLSAASGCSILLLSSVPFVAPAMIPLPGMVS
jgi:hypothetical protein